jgi:hypothetical protein
MVKLYVFATLITRDGFRKQIDLNELLPFVRYPLMPKVNVMAVKTSDMPIEELTCNYKEFYLKEYDELKSMHRHHIYATYEEV